MSLPSTYCPLPWMHLCVNPTGRFTLCCEDTLESDFSGQRDYNIINDKDAYWESPYLKWIRQAMQSGHRLRECSVCHQEEKLGLMSKRQYELEQWGKASELNKILYLDLKLGNRCNLQCVTCDPNSSSRLAQEYQDLGWDRNPPFQTGQMGIPVTEVFKANMKWCDNPEFWAKLRALLPGLSKLKITGGEPLINADLIDFLNQSQRKGMSDFSLQITTNGTQLSKKILSVLSTINTSIVVSLDGVGTINDFIRFPSRFADIIKNIKRLRDAGIAVRSNATFNMYNALYITDLIEFVHRFIGNRLTLIPIEHPAFLNPACAPDSFKQFVVKRIEVWRKKTSIAQVEYYVQQLTRRLFAAESCSTQFEKFIQYTTVLCNHRSLELGTIMPEIDRWLRQN